MEEAVKAGDLDRWERFLLIRRQVEDPREKEEPPGGWKSGMTRMNRAAYMAIGSTVTRGPSINRDRVLPVVEISVRQSP